MHVHAFIVNLKYGVVITYLSDKIFFSFWLVGLLFIGLFFLALLLLWFIGIGLLALVYVHCTSYRDRGAGFRLWLRFPCWRHGGGCGYPLIVVLLMGGRGKRWMWPHPHASPFPFPMQGHSQCNFLMKLKLVIKKNELWSIFMYLATTLYMHLR